MSHSSFENSSYIFISNPVSSASEIFAVRADHQNYVLSMIDFGGGSDIDPISTNTLIGSIYSAVTLRPESFSEARVYIYAKDLNNNTLKIIDPYVNTTPSDWQEIDTIDNLVAFTSKGNFMDEHNNFYVLNDSTNTLKVFSDLPRIDLTDADLNITSQSN